LLLNQLSPLCDTTLLSEPQPEIRAELVLANAAKINCRQFVSAKDIVHGDPEKNALFVANVYSKFPSILPPNGAVPGNTSSSNLVKDEQFQELLDNEDNDKREERGIY
jgi:hypothetical protein